MNCVPQQRGAALVGHLAELGQVEAGAVRGFRAWCDGPDAVRAYVDDLRAQFGQGHADVISGSLSQLCDLCFRHGRRPLAHHQASCKCLGADESWFANFVAAAAAGQREDAMLLATLIVRPDFAPNMVGLAEYLGATLSLAAPRSQPIRNTNNVIQLH